MNKQFKGERIYYPDTNEYYCPDCKKTHKVNTDQGRKCFSKRQR